MKGRTGFILFVVAFLLLIYWAEVSKPKVFNWRVTFHPNSGEPFGCQLFDEMMTKTMPKGYEVTSKDLNSLALDSVAMSKRNIIVQSDDDVISSYNIGRLDAIRKLVRLGSNVMVVQEHFWSIQEQLDIKRSESSWRDFVGFARNFRQNGQFICDTLIWKYPSSDYPERAYAINQILSGNALVVSSDKWERIIYKQSGIPLIDDDDYDENDEASFEEDTCQTEEDGNRQEENLQDEEVEDYVVFIRQKIGKGYFYILSAPELLTNYSITHNNTAELALRIMNELSDKPTLRTTAYLPKMKNEETISSLSYISRQAPLLWAYRLSLLAILLFFIFNAKRRQRIIPVMPEPVNHQLEFVKQIGTLYYQRGDNADMVIKKFKYLKERLRREVQIDISDPSGDEEALPQLAALTGYEVRHLKSVISQLRVLERQQHPYLTIDEMTKSLDDINNIYNSIN